MPIDARIPLGVVAPKIDSPQQVAGTLAQLANVQGEAQERQMRVSALQQSQADQAAMRQALKDSNGDLRVAAQKVLAINPELGATLLGHANSADKAKLDLADAKIQHDLHITNYTGQLIGGPLSAQSPEQAQSAWTSMLAQMQHAGLSIEGLPEQYDPNVAQQLASQAMTAQQRLEAQQKQIAEQRALAAAAAAAADKDADNKRADAAAAETGRHNRATEAQARSGAAEPLVPIIGPDGKPVLVRRSQAEGKTPASGAAAAKPSTGAERTALGFFNRAKQADGDLEQIEDKIAKMGIADQARLKYAHNTLQSQTGQSYNQAQRAFTEARLRKDSGAAIPETEFENDRLTYFVQPGDSTDTIAQKRRARNTVLASMGFAAGKAMGEFYGDDEAGTLISDYKAKAAGGNKIIVKAPDGSEHPFETQAQADAFKRLAGIK